MKETKANIIRISDAQDPRMRVFRDVKDKDLHRDGLFLVESELLLRRMLQPASLALGHGVQSVLVSEHRLGRLEDLLPVLTQRGCTVYVAEANIMESIIGMHFHQGVLSAGVPGPWQKLESVLPQNRPGVLVMCPEVHNAENLGAVMRVSAAMGAAGLILGPRCTHPFMRQTLRVSMGTAFTLPLVEAADDASFLQAAKDLGYASVASVCEESSHGLTWQSLERFVWPGRSILLLGSEGAGLPQQLVKLADHRVSIPMNLGTDSLNVAVAASVMLWERLRQRGEMREAGQKD